MYLKSIFTVCFMMVYVFSVGAQELYTPRNIQNAYQNQTRDKNGQPGAHYWQNRAVYDIKVDIKPENKMVYGSETIRYFNNSPDTLYKLNFKLIINQHKPGAMRSYPVPEEYLTSGIHVDSYAENGVSRKWEDDNDGTDKFIQLGTPLPPDTEIKLQIDWHYQLSERSGREGAITDSTFFLAYFHPRVAVYDDYVGWDVMPHTGSQEFYNDFNDYNFEVTVPRNYIVWATGTLENSSDVLQEKYYKRFKNSLTSDHVISIIDSDDLRQMAITSPNPTNTWKWTAENVSDIAIAVSNEYLWDAASVVVDKKTGRRASVQAAYDSVASDFYEMVNHASHAIRWFSENVPGIPYPYPSMTVVRGEADMEYPMMANDSSFPFNDRIARFIAQHEIAHTYFPFYMGTNETRYGFMDEGWATALEYLIAVDDVGEELADASFKQFRVKGWITDPSFLQDLPIITPSNVLSRPAMSSNMYGKAGLAYLALRDLLGEEIFLETLHEYMNRWNGKHPMPWDFFYTFNDHLNENLNWFWESWFFSNGYIDMAIDDVQRTEKNIEITIKNIGGMAAPVDILIESVDGEIERYHQTPTIWKTDLEKTVIKIEHRKEIKKITLDGGIWMDADTTDNLWIPEK